MQTQTPKFESNNNNSLPNSTTTHQHTTISSTKYSPSGTHMISLKKRYGPSHNFFPYFRFILFLFVPSSFSPSPQPSHIPFRLSSTNLTDEKKAMIDEWKWWKWWPKDEVVVARLQSSMLKMMEKKVQLCYCTYFLELQRKSVSNDLNATGETRKVGFVARNGSGYRDRCQWRDDFS